MRRHRVASFPAQAQTVDAVAAGIRRCRMALVVRVILHQAGESLLACPRARRGPPTPLHVSVEVALSERRGAVQVVPRSRCWARGGWRVAAAEGVAPRVVLEV